MEAALFLDIICTPIGGISVREFHGCKDFGDVENVLQHWVHRNRGCDISWLIKDRETAKLCKSILKILNDRKANDE